MEGTGSARKKGGQVSLAELPLFSAATSRQEHFTLVLGFSGVKDRGREREMEIHPLCSTLQQVFLVILSRGIFISSLLYNDILPTSPSLLGSSVSVEGLRTLTAGGGGNTIIFFQNNYRTRKQTGRGD